MTKRLFVFGCSMTRYSWATWADLVGSNFDEYYNYARSGSSNVLSMNRFFEANNKFQFNSETDTIMIMITGLGRFSYYLTKQSWVTHGDLYSYLDANPNKDPVTEYLVKNIFDINWAIYNGWTAIRSMKDFLVAKNIPHEFLLGIQIEHFKDISDMETSHCIDDITSLCRNKQSFDKWFLDYGTRMRVPYTPFYSSNNHPDGHPNQHMHYEFLKEFLPEYDTEKTKQTFDYVESIWDGSTQNMQGYTYDTLYGKQHNLAFKYPLFGQHLGEI